MPAKKLNRIKGKDLAHKIYFSSLETGATAHSRVGCIVSILGVFFVVSPFVLGEGGFLLRSDFMSSWSHYQFGNHLAVEERVGCFAFYTLAFYLQS